MNHLPTRQTPRRQRGTTSAAGAPRRPGGFSLIELALVLAILMTLAALAAPRYANALANYRVDAAARRMLADLRLTQSRAKALSSTQTFTFSTTGSRYQINGMSDPDRPSPNTIYSVNLADEPYLASIASVSPAIFPSVSFNGYGTPSGSGTIVLQCGAAQKTIVIDASTGNVAPQ